MLTPDIIKILSEHFDTEDQELGIRPPTFIAQLIKIEKHDNKLYCITLKDGQGQLISALARDSIISDKQLEGNVIHCAQYRVTRSEQNELEMFLYELDVVESIKFDEPPNNVTKFPYVTRKLRDYQPIEKTDWISVRCTEWQVTPTTIVFKITDDGFSMQCVVFPPIKEQLIKYQKEGLELHLNNPIATLIPEKYYKFPGIKYEIKLNIFSNLKVINPEDNSVLYENKSDNSYLPENPTVQDEKVSTINNTKNDEPPVQMRREYTKISSLTKTITHDWVRATIDNFRLYDNCIRMWLRDESASISCTIFSPVLEGITPCLTEGLIVEFKNSAVKEIDAQYRKGETGLEIKINKYVNIKLLDTSDKILYEYAFQREPAAEKLETVDVQYKKPSDSSDIIINNPEGNLYENGNSCPPENSVPQDTQASAIGIKIEESPSQITQKFIKMSTLTPSNSYEWVRATVEKLRVLNSCIRLWLRDTSMTMPCTVADPIFQGILPFIRNGLVVEFKNSLIQKINAEYQTGSEFEIKINRHTSIKLLDNSDIILYEYQSDCKPSTIIISDESQKSLTVSKKKRSSEKIEPVELPAAKKINRAVKENRCFTKLADLQIGFKHDWIQVTVESMTAGSKCANLKVFDDTARMKCTIFSPIFPSAVPFIENDTILEIKNAKVQVLSMSYREEGLNTLELIGNSFSSFKVLDTEENILFSYCPSNVSIITSNTTANTSTRGGSILFDNCNAKTTAVRPENQWRKKSEATFLSQIQEVQSCQANSYIDICGLVTSGQLESKPRGQGYVPFRCITLEDDTGCVKIGMWGKTAINFSSSKESFFFKNLYVKEYNNQKELVFGGTSTFLKQSIS